MRLRTLPLRRKLVLIIMTASVAALVLAGLASLAFDLLLARRELLNELTTDATVVAQNVTAALSFDDSGAAAETLGSLRTRPEMQAACVYDATGRLFAWWGRDPRQACPGRSGPEGWSFDWRALAVSRPVSLGERTIGSVLLRSGLGELSRRLRWQAAALSVVLAGALLVALGLSSRLQRLIADPVLELADTARRVSAERDYTLRATAHAQDELGTLVDAFNDMLGEIQLRDRDLLQAQHLLEARVEERTRALQQELAERQRAEELLAIRNEELIRTNRDLDDFAYIASHDLREPLRGIRNYATFLLEDSAAALDDEGRAKLHTLQRLSRRMEHLIESLLHYSRIGRLDLSLDRVDMNALVDEVLDSLAISLAEAHVQVSVARLPAVRCDRARTGEVFSNLITNAMKYSDAPEKRIEIGAESPPGRPVVFLVRDNGLGIPPKHVDAVFRIFKRLHPHDRYGGGVGVGLTIVRKIVERHEGNIWIESAPGKGTTVFFTLEREVGDEHRDSPKHLAG